MTIGRVIRPAISNPVSSSIPKWKAAVKPMMDHRNGIIRRLMGHFLLLCNNIPKVNMVVGHGSPKVGDEG